MSRPRVTRTQVVRSDGTPDAQALQRSLDSITAALDGLLSGDVGQLADGRLKFGEVDPVIGLDAPLGSVYIKTNPNEPTAGIYQKTSSPPTGWQQLAVSGSTASGDTRLLTAALTADQADITGTGLVVLSGLNLTVAVGVWMFEYFIIYQAKETTTGVEFVVNHLGTSTAFVSNARFGSTGGGAATGIADQVGVGTAAGLMEVKTQRANNSRPGVTIGVDTADANCLMIVEGVIHVSVSGTLQIEMAAEAAALICRAKAGSCVRVLKCG